VCLVSFMEGSVSDKELLFHVIIHIHNTRKLNVLNKEVFVCVCVPQAT